MKALRLLAALSLLVPSCAHAADRRAPDARIAPPARPASSLPAPTALPASAAHAQAKSELKAQESLSGVAQAVTAEAAAVPADDGGSAARFFDVRSPKAYAAAVAVGAVGAATGGAGLPAAYSAARALSDPPRPAVETPLPRGDRFFHNIEAVVAFAPMMFLGAAARFVTESNALFPFSLAMIAGLYAMGMEQTLSNYRSRVVGGWQASHDQKFRIDPSTGKLKDVRGTNKAYGEDRYEVKEPGHVAALERLWLRLAAVGFGLYWLAGAPSWHYWAFGATTTALLMLKDWKRFNRRPYVPSAEDRAHAAKF